MVIIMNSEALQFEKMTKTPTKKLVIMLGIPTIISMLVTAIYNIADTYFVTQLGAEPSAAVGVVFPLMAIIQAVGFTFGMGSSSLISAKLGEKKGDEAQKIGSSAFYIAISIGVLITLISSVFIESLMKILGATNSVLPYAVGYGRYIIYGFPIMIASFVMNNILRAEGKSKLAMIGLTTGGILNIILDPIFIYNLNLGTSGAAIATLISQTVSFLILLSMFVFKKSIITLSIKKVTKKLSIYLEIFKVGLPSFCRQGLASIAVTLLNNQAGTYGDAAALSAISIVSKIFTVIFSVGLGIGQGYQPVCGYNYSAGYYKRVKESMLFTLVFGTLLMTSLCILSYIFAEEAIAFFAKEAKEKELIIKIGSQALRYQCIALPFLSLNVITNMTFQSIRKKLLATILSCCRQGIFFIPLVLILPVLFELTGVELVQAISDFCTFLITIPFYIWFVKDINKKIKENEIKQEPYIEKAYN